MGKGGFLKRASDFYVGHAGLIGALYCIVPSLVAFGAQSTLTQFREVYLVRLGLALVVGGVVGALVSRYGASLWIIKHRSVKGPITVLDGGLIGAGVGAGIGLLPPLTLLVESSNLELAKTVIIIVWLGAAAAGVIIGMVLAAIGRNHVSREWPAEEGQGQ